MIEYAIVGRLCGGTYPPVREVVCGIEPNEKFCPNSKAPTMGRSHDHSEFKTVWSAEALFTFERMTAVNYLRVLMEEFRWGDREPFPVMIVPYESESSDEKGGKSVVIEICPQCGADIIDMVIATYPPIPCKKCMNCGWSWESAPEKIERRLFAPPKE